jgi:hypothetical protein
VHRHAQQLLVPRDPSQKVPDGLSLPITPLSATSLDVSDFQKRYGKLPCFTWGSFCQDFLVASGSWWLPGSSALEPLLFSPLQEEILERAGRAVQAAEKAPGPGSSYCWATCSLGLNCKPDEPYPHPARKGGRALEGREYHPAWASMFHASSPFPSVYVIQTPGKQNLPLQKVSLHSQGDKVQKPSGFSE